MVLTGSVWPKFRYICEPSCSELYTLCTPNPTPPHPLKKTNNFITVALNKSMHARWAI